MAEQRPKARAEFHVSGSKEGWALEGRPHLLRYQ
jgi:hypothetical protein